MHLGILKKIIFSSFLYINFIQTGYASEFLKSNLVKNRDNKITWSKFSNDKLPSNSLNFALSNISEEYPIKVNFIEDNQLPLLVNLNEKKKELIIQSDKQFEENNVVYAEGNVLVLYKNYVLKADKLIYEKINQNVIASGNISLTFGNQSFEMADLQYNFINQKGSLYEVKGLINTKNFLKELNYEFTNTDSKPSEIIKVIKKNTALNTPLKVQNWFISTDKIEIDGNTWKSKKAFFTNDLLELNQAKLVFNSLEITPKNEDLIVNSSLNYLILDEKLSIPFWIGKRTINASEDQFLNRWKIGYDNLDKDGYFIGRKFDQIDLSENIFLNLEPQFLIERSFKGYTKSFVNNGASITSDKVKQESNFSDYFALNSQINGNIYNWNWEINKQLNSFDSKKFINAVRLKTKFNKEIYFLDSKWDISFFGVYRDRIWNGSLGESEIYAGYGSKLEKSNSWTVNGVSKTEKLSIGIGNFKGEALHSKNLINSKKSNLFYSLNQKFPILVTYPPNNFVDSSFKYIPKPVTKGLKLDTKLELYSSIYENGNNQNYIGFGIGPEVTFGNFKRKAFDYTKLSVIPIYRVKGGDSLFKFDQIADKFTLDIDFDQQIYGPIMLKSKATLNLDEDSENFGDFITSSISLNWKKRSYEVGIYYQPHNEEVGVAFTLFGFK